MQLLRKSLFSLTGGLLLGSMSLVGCGGFGQDGSTSDQAYAADTTDTADQVSALVSVSTDGIDTQASGLTSTIAAQAAVANVTAKLASGCVTATLQGSTATYVMNNCTGPYGLVSLTGTLSVGYTVTGSGAGTTVTVALSGSGIKLNNATLDVNSSAVISGPSTNRTAVVSSTTSAESARGNSIAHSGNYTAGWDGSCVTLTGTFMTRVGLSNYSTVITDYKRCLNTCPKTGTITFTGKNIITLAFDGTASADLTVNGKAGSLPLLCIAAK